MADPMEVEDQPEAPTEAESPPNDADAPAEPAPTTEAADTTDATDNTEAPDTTDAAEPTDATDAADATEARDAGASEAKSDAVDLALETSPEAVPEKKLFKHSAKDFEMGNILGDGAFGKVIVGTVKNEESPYFKQKFAIKIMDKRHIVKNKKIKYVNIEKQVFLKTKSHPFICHMHFSYQDPYSLFMVLDLCSEDTLSYLIYKYLFLSEELTRIYVSELISCLEFMHSIGIYHRDVKPENILIGFDQHIRLTDFGTAKVIDMDDEKQVQKAKEKQEKGQQSDDDDDENENKDSKDAKDGNNLKVDFNEERNRKQSFVGTAQYVPPEMLANKPFSFAGMDFWAVGCLIYQCLVGKPPFSASNEYLTFKKIESMEYDLPDSLSASATDIITKFLNADLENRLGMKGYDAIRNHSFFESMPWDWEEMKKQAVPMRPQTPDMSPAKQDPNRGGRSSSAWNELETLKDVKVQNMDVSGNSRDAAESGASSNGSSAGLNRMNTDRQNEQLFERWKKFLNQGEQIEFGSAVSQSKMFGMQTDRSVMLLTSQQRLLLIDGTEMKLKKDISTKDIRGVEVIDTSSITITRVGKKKEKQMKLKITGQTGQRWKDAIDAVRNAGK